MKINFTTENSSPLYYLGNRFLSLPDKSGHMTLDQHWLDEMFALILKSANGASPPYAVLHEPFAGSASFSLAAMKHKIAKKYNINDSNNGLINLHKLIKTSPKAIIESYVNLVEAYKSKSDKPSYYCEQIEIYNNENTLDNKSKILSFLINYSWGGVLYYDDSGKIIYQEEQMQRCLDKASITTKAFSKAVFWSSELLNDNDVTFSSGHFIDCLSNVKQGDCVVLNPPYPENPRIMDNRVGIYRTMYSSTAMHDDIIRLVQQLDDTSIDYIMTYGFYNPELADFVLRDSHGLRRNYLRRLGYDHCAFGTALDQVYLGGKLKIPTELTSTYVDARVLLNDDNPLTVAEALKRYQQQ